MHHTLTALLLLATAGTGWSGLLQEAPPTDLLRGPAVADSAREQAMPMLGNGAQLRAIKRQAVPVRRWFEEFGKLQLSESQQLEFARRKRTFNEASLAFRDQHAERLADARKQLRTLVGGRDRQQLQSLDASARERARALETEIRLIEQESPAVEQLQLSCWWLLNGDQRDRFRVRLQEIRAEMRQRRARSDQAGGRDRRDRSMQDGMESDASDDAMQDAMQQDGAPAGTP